MEKALRSQTVPCTICHSPQQSRGETKLMGGSRVWGSEQADSGGLRARGAALSPREPPEGGQAGVPPTGTQVLQLSLLRVSSLLEVAWSPRGNAPSRPRCFSW